LNTQAAAQKELFRKLISELGEINDKLLLVLKKKLSYDLQLLLEGRTKLSEQIQSLSTGLNLKMGDFDQDFQVRASQVLAQDEELLIYLEHEVQKLQGRFQRRQLLMRRTA
jgi:hypothetical protein